MSIRGRVAASPFARLAAFPTRAAQVGKYDARLITESARWLAHSRENTNFTYDLTDINRDYLAWWVAEIAECPVKQVRDHFAELLSDEILAHHILRCTEDSPRHRLADIELRWHRYLGWYALVRALGSRHIVETGTDKGRGTLVFASAVMRNKSGHVTTIDNNHASGYLIRPPYDSVVTRVIGDSFGALQNLDKPIDFFLHDSLHTREHEAQELNLVAPKLSEDAVVLSDNAHSTDVLAKWAEANGMSFTFFQEQPARHWYPGGGIGLARRSRYTV